MNDELFEVLEMTADSSAGAPEGDTFTDLASAPTDVETHIAADIIENLRSSAQNAPSQPGQVGSEAGEAKAQSTAKSEIPGGAYEVGVDMYLIVLETVLNIVGKWYSGTDDDFNIERTLKKSYREIAITYAKESNIVITPATMFFLCTIIIVGTVGVKAHRKKSENAALLLKKRQAANLVAKAKAGEQVQMFSPDTAKSAVLRKDYSFDENDMYKKDVNGNYLKKEDRTTRVDLDVKAFVEEYRGRNGEAPSNKAITEYLKTLQKI